MQVEAAFRRLELANPVADPVSLLERRPDPAAFLRTVQERSLQLRAPDPSGDQQPPRRRVWLRAALAGAAAVIVAIVLVAVLTSGGDAPPDIATTLPDTTVPSTVPVDPESAILEQVDALEAAGNAGDLGAVLAVLSPEANCDVAAPGTEVETCEQFWGANIGMGGSFVIECTPSGLIPVPCTVAFQSEVHVALGYPDHEVSSSIPMSLDADGRLITGAVDATAPNFSGGGDATDRRLWAFMEEMFPEMGVSPNFGPNPYDFDAGVAALEAARALNDPYRLAVEFERAFDAGDLSAAGDSRFLRCATDEGSGFCDDFLAFMSAIDGGLSLDCTGQPAVDGEITCPVVLSSAIHDALASAPVTADGIMTYRGGSVRTFTLDLRFSEDPSVHDAFFEFARSQQALFDGELPIYDETTGPLWLIAAEEFASSQ